METRSCCPVPPVVADYSFTAALPPLKLSKHKTKGVHSCKSTVHSRGGDPVVPTAGDPPGVRLLRDFRRHLVRGVHSRGTEVNVIDRSIPNIDPPRAI